MSTYVLGDIHANFKALKEVLIDFDYDNDKLILLGDLVDGYAQTFECVEELLKIKNLVFVRGNHDQWFINWMNKGSTPGSWTTQGGDNTIYSYKASGYTWDTVPQSHRNLFLKSVYFHEQDDSLFIHGGFNYPTMPVDCNGSDLMWDRELIQRFKNGLKVKEYWKIFVGHTTTEKEGAEPVAYDGGEGCAELIQLDCGAGYKGRLCLYNFDDDTYKLSEWCLGFT